MAKHLVETCSISSLRLSFEVLSHFLVALQLFPRNPACLVGCSWHTSDASTLILSGFEGHHLINDICIEKVCSCDNGIAARGSECPEYGSALGQHKL